MTTTTRKPAKAKAIITLARCFVKATNAVVYLTRPSKDGEPNHKTTIVDGRATGCTCPARDHSYKPCKHMTHYEAKEQARSAANDQSYADALATKYAKEAQDRADHLATFDVDYMQSY